MHSSQKALVGSTTSLDTNHDTSDQTVDPRSDTQYDTGTGTDPNQQQGISKDTDSNTKKASRRCRNPFVIEPVMMLYNAAYSVMFPLTSQYVLAVMTERYVNGTTGGNSSGTCGKVDMDSDFYRQQQKAQAESSLFTLYYNLTQGIPALFVALFLGMYSILVLLKIDQPCLISCNSTFKLHLKYSLG